MGNKMDFSVFRGNSDLFKSNWFEPANEQGIPKIFVVDSNGRLAWIGHPRQLEDVLHKMVKGQWSLVEARKERDQRIKVDSLDKELNYQLWDYIGTKPDSALLLINKSIQSEPMLTYASFTSFNTLILFLSTNVDKAYEYGENVLKYSDSYNSSFYSLIDVFQCELTNDCQWNKEIPSKIYHLVAKAYQMKIDQFYETIDVPKAYYNKSIMYFKGKDIPNAVQSVEKAIELLKSKASYLQSRIQTYTNQLDFYKGQ